MEQGEMPGQHQVETVEEERDRLTKEIGAYVSALNGIFVHAGGVEVPTPNLSNGSNEDLRALAESLKGEFDGVNKRVIEILQSSN